MIRCLLCVLLALITSGCSTTGRVTPAHSTMAVQLPQQAQSEEQPLSFLTPEQQAKLGVPSLTIEQQREWSSLLTSMVQSAQTDGELNRIARTRLELDGWVPMEVLGYQRITLDERKGERRYLIIRHQSGTWGVEDAFGSAEVGPCWGRTSVLGPRAIIDRSGIEDSFLSIHVERIR